MNVTPVTAICSRILEDFRRVQLLESVPGQDSRIERRRSMRVKAARYIELNYPHVRN